MYVAICDDEAVIREAIVQRIKNAYPDITIQLYENGEALTVQEREPDILFLDIQLPRRNGMEIARELRKRWTNTTLIFVTALEEYVFQAFDVGAFHYLVKPIDDEKFTEVLDKAVKLRTEKNIRGSEEKYFMINNGGSHCKVVVDDIVYAEVFNRKVVIHKINEDIEYYGTMSELERAAGESFFRPHRAYLINFKYIEKYDKANIYLENGVALMSKQKYSEFVKKYMKYNQRREK